MSWSVIIPVLNEQVRLPHLIDHVNDRLPDCEIVVVDGGSEDETWQWVKDQKDVKSFQCHASRGYQLAIGAQQAQGEKFLFLHADSYLAQDVQEDMERILKMTGVSAGAFKFSIEHSAWQYRLMEFIVDKRCRYLKMPYGDQGIFISRDVYFLVGGFSSYPLMEDVELVKKIKKTGRLVISDKPLKTSPRRIERRGFWLSCFKNVILVILFHLNVSPHFLKKIYER